MQWAIHTTWDARSLPSIVLDGAGERSGKFQAVKERCVLWASRESRLVPCLRTQQRGIYKYNPVAYGGTQAGFLFAILENTEQIALEFFAEIAIIFGAP